jgi:hypothetical protein
MQSPEVENGMNIIGRVSNGVKNTDSQARKLKRPQEKA